MGVQWNLKTILFTKDELSRLTRNFFHPSATKLFNVISCRFPDFGNYETFEALTKITEDCICCQQKLTPQRLDASLSDSYIIYNGTAAFYLMCGLMLESERNALYCI